MEHTNTHSFGLKLYFNILMKMVASVVTVAIASGALFLLGFHVIPVFADQAPHFFEQSIDAQVKLHK